MDKYGKALLSSASQLDAATDSCGEITRMATAIVEEGNQKSTVALLKKISEIVTQSRNQSELLRHANAVHSCLLTFYGYQKINDICSPEHDEEDTRTLEELLTELNSLIGLQKVKSKVHDLIIYQKVQLLRKANNLHSEKGTLHLAFTGNPGTGKTTVARIVGRVYKQIGLLSKGHFTEVSRTDLIAGYQGQTALKVKKVIDQARGGVLFIDEAYSITENDHSDSYGRECLTELTKALEDYRDDLVVIVAGYTEPMNDFFASNPGLKSRFNTFIEFDDYSADELADILVSICDRNDYTLENSAKEKIHKYFESCISKKEENFANGRLARNIYDSLVMNQAKRVIKLPSPSVEELCTITAEDFEIADDDNANVEMSLK